MAKLPHKSAIVGKNIRSIRLFKGLTTQQLADRCGLSAGHLQMLETGYRRINVDHLFAVAEVLRVKPAELIDPTAETFFDSQRTLPFVEASDLNNFSVCPDRESVEKIAKALCLCPPEVIDPRAFGVGVRYPIQSPALIRLGGTDKPYKFGIAVCVPSSLLEVDLSDPEELALYEIINPARIPQDAMLVKVTGHPVYFTPVCKFSFLGGGEGETYIRLLSYTEQKGYQVLIATVEHKEETRPTAEWFCRKEAFYPDELRRFIFAQKRPRKEE